MFALPASQPTLWKLLTSTAMHQQKYSPELYKMGIVTLCIKKDKDALIMDNHRGIVVTQLFSKLLEHIVAARENPTATQKQNRLQFGFTEGLSSTMAALLVTSVTAEHKDQGLATYMVALDTQKAFNTIWHDSLFRKFCGGRPPQYLHHPHNSAPVQYHSG